MNDIVIKAEHISKQYRLGEIGTGTLGHDLKRWWYKAKGKEDPYLKIGEVNDRTSMGNTEFVWALKDINFEVREGEVLGIIGRNGAGKSTLLKILSKITRPTGGQIKIQGRAASLLEVGTGFHPELSGRENIYLNGAILGMTKTEINKKFEEIVDFASVQRYIDTPVKRYSSGMYVRLAFAVAAHLEPEILVVDEVLSVGDVEFQRKCLGKMKDVSSQGRTVLFVSHNMQAVRSLCTKGLLLNNGHELLSGPIEEVLKAYSTNIFAQTDLTKVNKKDRLSRTNGKALISSFILTNDEGNMQDNFVEDENIHIKLLVEIKTSIESLGLYFAVKNAMGNEIITNYIEGINDGVIKKGVIVRIDIRLEKNTIRAGEYYFYIAIGNYDCIELYDVIDNNIDIPVIAITPAGGDSRLSIGYFSINPKIDVIIGVE